MKIPGLNEALQGLDTLNEEMLPLLGRIADGVDVLVTFTETVSEWLDRNGH
jgi:hypothetical protein